MQPITFTIADRGPMLGRLGATRNGTRQTLSFEAISFDTNLLAEHPIIQITRPDHSILRARPLGVFDLLVQGPGGMAIKGLWLEAC
jgi:hypothetical protein